MSLLSAPLRELRMKIGMHPDRESVAARARRFRLPGAHGAPLPDCEEAVGVCVAERSAGEFDLGDYVRRFMEDVPMLQRVNNVLNGPKERWRLATVVDGKLQIEERR